MVSASGYRYQKWKKYNKKLKLRGTKLTPLNQTKIKMRIFYMYIKRNIRDMLTMNYPLPKSSGSSPLIVQYKTIYYLLNAVLVMFLLHYQWHKSYASWDNDFQLVIFAVQNKSLGGMNLC